MRGAATGSLHHISGMVYLIRGPEDRHYLHSIDTTTVCQPCSPEMDGIQNSILPDRSVIGSEDPEH